MTQCDTNLCSWDIPQAFRDHCNKITAAKYTNDLMHGLNTTAFMAAHSVTGSSSKGETRPSLPHEDVKKIVCLYFFFSGNQ